MIRLATHDDFDFIYGLYMHPAVNPFLLYEHMDRQSFMPIFSELLANNQKFVFTDNGVSCGMCKLIPLKYRTSHIVYLGGVAIDPTQSGKGYGLAMLNDIIDYAKQQQFKRIELGVATINKKAIAVYQKAGFEHEGVLKNYSYFPSDGRYVDEAVMAKVFYE